MLLLWSDWIISCSFFFFFKQKTAYEMRISDWSSTCALPIWEEIAALVEVALQVLDEFFEHAMLRRRIERHVGRARQRDAFRPFIGEQDDRLREVQRGEFGIDRYGDDLVREGDVVGFEP